MFLSGAGPLNRLDPTKIPALQRFANMPREVVAVLGENRGGHTGEVFSIAISPDGRLAASLGGDADGKLRIWDVATMRQKFVLTPGHNLREVVFAPDGKTLAVGDEYDGNGSLTIWDLTGAEPKKRTLFNTAGAICLAFSPDGRRILVGGQSRSKEKKDGRQPVLQLWDVETGKEIRRFEGHAWRIEHVAFSPNGRLALSSDGNGSQGGGDKTFCLWDVGTGKELQRCTGNAVESLAFSPDGKQALMYVHSRGLVRCDVEGWKELAVYREAGWPAIFAPDQRHALVGMPESKGRSVGLLDLENGEVREFAPRLNLRHGDRLDLALSADGRRAVSGGSDKIVRLWDVEAGKELLPRTGHTGSATCCAFSPDGKTLASGGSDDTVRLWELTDTAPRERAVLWGGFRSHGCTSVAFAPEGRMLAAGFSSHGSILLWDVAGAEPKARQALRCPPRAGPREPWGVSFGSDSTLMGWQKYSGFLDILHWNLSGDEPVELPRLKRSIPATDPSNDGLAISADSKTVAVGLEGGSVEFWDMSGKEPKKTHDLKAHQRFFVKVALASDGKTLATCGVDESKVTVGEELAVKLWDLSAGQAALRSRLGHHGLAPQIDSRRRSGVIFTRDGKRLLSWGPDGTIIVWDVASRKKLRGRKLPGCTSCAIAPDGRHLAACMDKGAVYILRLDLPK